MKKLFLVAICGLCIYPNYKCKKVTNNYYTLDSNVTNNYYTLVSNVTGYAQQFVGTWYGINSSIGGNVTININYSSANIVSFTSTESATWPFQSNCIKTFNFKINCSQNILHDTDILIDNCGNSVYRIFKGYFESNGTLTIIEWFSPDTTASSFIYHLHK